MRHVKNFNIDKEDNRVQWTVISNIQVNIDNIDSALVDESRNIVFVLSGEEGNLESLRVLSSEGKVVAKLTPPSDFDFYYLSKHPSLGVSVVCIAAKKVDGWTDWHFGYDHKRGELYRYCPAR